MPSVPNILLILTDQHRLSAVSCYGDTPCRTPNIDRLASNGVRFETAYTVCPVCSPARATIMTGLYPHAHGICSNVHNLGCSVHGLYDRPELLSRRLERAGYVNGYSGKWHLGNDSDTAFHTTVPHCLPRDVGFIGQDFPGHGGGGFQYPEYLEYLERNGWKHAVSQARDIPHRVMPYGILSGPVESTVPYFLAEHTIGLIDTFNQSDAPFFIWHNFWGPHGPYAVTREYYDMYRDVEIPEWPNFRWTDPDPTAPRAVKRHPNHEHVTWDDWAEGIRHYYAFATMIDAQIGRILDHLDDTGLSDNTIVIFAADHGETLGSHAGLTDKGWNHFEEIQRIPLIVRLPERMMKPGRSSGDVLEEWVSLADLYPTILDYAGAEYSADRVHGRSIKPLLDNESTVGRPDEIVVEFNGVNSLATNMVTVRRGAWKYGWNASNRDELYNLDDDPFEMTNRIDDPLCSTVVNELRDRLDIWMAETDYPARGMYRQSRLGEYSSPGWRRLIGESTGH